MEWIFFWIIGSVIIGVIAGSKGRSGFGYFILSLLLSPLLAGLLVLGLPKVSADALVAGGEVATPDTHVRCPDCRELIRVDARKCKHCGIALVPAKMS